MSGVVVGGEARKDTVKSATVVPLFVSLSTKNVSLLVIFLTIRTREALPSDVVRCDGAVRPWDRRVGAFRG